jgi:hypothetical protein
VVTADERLAVRSAEIGERIENGTANENSPARGFFISAVIKHLYSSPVITRRTPEGIVTVL